MYHHEKKSVTLDSSRVNDGLWHYLEARWMKDPPQIVLTLDYGQVQVSAQIITKTFLKSLLLHN